MARSLRRCGGRSEGFRGGPARRGVAHWPAVGSRESQPRAGGGRDGLAGRRARGHCPRDSSGQRPRQATSWARDLACRTGAVERAHGRPGRADWATSASRRPRGRAGVGPTRRSRRASKLLDPARVSRPGTGPVPSPRHGLTPRELEVVRLVAAGRSNRAIAAALFISVPTVKRHLTNILGKLDLPSRSALNTYAHTHGLA